VHHFHWRKLFGLRKKLTPRKNKATKLLLLRGVSFLPELLCNTISHNSIRACSSGIQLEKRGCADTFGIREIQFNERIANILRSRVHNYKLIKTAVVSNGIHKGMMNVMSGNTARVVFTMLKKDVGRNGFCGCTWWLVTLTPYQE
jgi:hypothetical protein